MSAEPSFNQKVVTAATWIATSKYFVVLTGAGISTPSGIPDYATVRRIGQEGQAVPPENLAINWDKVTPAFSHYALVRLQDAGLLRFLITQNLDNLHRRSGIRPEILCEIHGNITLERCENCGNVVSKYEDRSPKCACGGRFRSSIIRDEENPWAADIAQVMTQAKNADVFCVVGSSLRVDPVNKLPVMAKQAGAKLIIINRETTSLDKIADLRFFESADEVLQAIVVRMGIPA